MKNKESQERKQRPQMLSEVDTIINRRLQIMMGLGFFYYVGYSFYDKFVYPDDYQKLLIVRLVVGAIMLLTLLICRLRISRGQAANLTTGILSLASMGFGVMIYLADGSKSDYHYGVMLVILSFTIINSFQVIRFILYAVFSAGFYLLTAYLAPVPFDYMNFTEAICFLSGEIVMLTVLVRLYQIQYIKQYDLNVELSKKEDELKKSYEVVKYQSERDPLTQVLNRRSFEKILADYFEKAKESHEVYYLAFIDVDDFKFINDNYGHLLGDIALQSIAKVLTQHVRGNTPVCRYGGDEFVILFDISNEEVVKSRIDQLKHSVELLRFDANDKKIGVSISVGVAPIDPQLHQNAKELVNFADLSMLKAKRDRKNRGKSS